MYDERNPARSRPLSDNVKRLMRLARESPDNPEVSQVNMEISARELMYCNMQGNIFMAAAEKNIPMHDFASMYMNSQLAGVIDYSFSCAGNMESDSLSSVLRMPLLLKSPDAIVDILLWIDRIVSDAEKSSEDDLNVAVVKALREDRPLLPPPEEAESRDENELAGIYEYAYWLGYIYRFECFIHDESSRMVYGVFPEHIMTGLYAKLKESGMMEADLAGSAREICRLLDAMITGDKRSE